MIDMIIYRGYRKLKGIVKSIFLKAIYINRIKGPIFSIGNGGEILIIGKKSLLNFGGDNVIRNNVSIRITGGEIHLGKNVFINDNCCIVSRKKIQIGEDCLIGQNVCIYDNNHNYKDNIPVNKQGFTVSEVNIGQNVWIGSNVVILPGVNIGNNVVIAAGSIVKNDIEDNCIYYNKTIGTVKRIRRN